jgi:hypothetical protein
LHNEYKTSTHYLIFLLRMHIFASNTTRAFLDVTQ